MKTIYHLSGLPRSGNTLLSSILNQNPKINTTPLSDLNYLMVESHDKYMSSKLRKNFPDLKSFDNAMSSFYYNFYKDWPGDIIIQRSNTGHFGELKVIDKYIKNDFKCIVLVRDLFEVLASFIKLYKADKNFFVNKNRSTDQSKIEGLLDKDSIIKNSLDSIYNLYYGWYDSCLFIQYNNLVNNTKQEIDKIYKFLEIEPFDHSYINLNQFKVNNISYDDEVYGKNLHKIKTDKIEKGDNSEYMKYIPDMFLKKYEFTNNWLNGI